MRFCCQVFHHKDTKDTKNHKGALNCCRHTVEERCPWIPAFAGMTVVVGMTMMWNTQFFLLSFSHNAVIIIKKLGR